MWSIQVKGTYCETDNTKVGSNELCTLKKQVPSKSRYPVYSDSLPSEDAAYA